MALNFNCAFTPVMVMLSIKRANKCNVIIYFTARSLYVNVSLKKCFVNVSCNKS